MSEAMLPLDVHSVNLACFEVNAQIYAVEVAHVREIVRMQPITPLPNAPRLIEGVIDLRGAVIPVVDLARALGRGVCNGGPQSRIFVLEFEALALGLRVDAATDVLSLEASRLEPVPELAAKTGYGVVRHVVRRENEPPVMVLSLDSLVEKVSRSNQDAAIEPERIR